MTSPPAPTLPRPVTAVVIGASAGGVEALTTLLPALPSTLRVPVLVVLHLPPARPSMVVSLLAGVCAVPVHDADDKMPIEPGVVYLAPADYHLLVGTGPCVTLSADEPVHFSRPSIDVLFESAADVFTAGLLGIILTGASSDGARGLDAIRRAGGTTVVQDPHEARVPTMVQAALALGEADRVQPLAGIAALLRLLPHD